MSMFRRRLMMMQGAGGAGPYIEFADPNVGAICAQKWGSGGRITYAQAAAVTDIGTVFKGNTVITSFDELRHFTGLTSIPSTAFNGCTALVSIVFPDTVTTIGSSAMRDSSVSHITVGSGCTDIELYWLNGTTSQDITIVCKAVVPPALSTRLASNVKRVYVPAGSVSDYQAIPYWSQYPQILPIT